MPPGQKRNLFSKVVEETSKPKHEHRLIRARAVAERQKAAQAAQGMQKARATMAAPTPTKVPPLVAPPNATAKGKVSATAAKTGALLRRKRSGLQGVPLTFTHKGVKLVRCRPSALGMQKGQVAPVPRLPGQEGVPLSSSNDEETADTSPTQPIAQTAANRHKPACSGPARTDDDGAEDTNIKCSDEEGSADDEGEPNAWECGSQAETVIEQVSDIEDFASEHGVPGSPAKKAGQDAPLISPRLHPDRLPAPLPLPQPSVLLHLQSALRPNQSYQHVHPAGSTCNATTSALSRLGVYGHFNLYLQMMALSKTTPSALPTLPDSPALPATSPPFYVPYSYVLVHLPPVAIVNAPLLPLLFAPREGFTLAPPHAPESNAPVAFNPPPPIGHAAFQQPPAGHLFGPIQNTQDMFTGYVALDDFLLVGNPYLGNESTQDNLTDLYGMPGLPWNFNLPEDGSLASDTSLTPEYSFGMAAPKFYTNPNFGQFQPDPPSFLRQLAASSPPGQSIANGELNRLPSAMTSPISYTNNGVGVSGLSATSSPSLDGSSSLHSSSTAQSALPALRR